MTEPRSPAEQSDHGPLTMQRGKSTDSNLEIVVDSSSADTSFLRHVTTIREQFGQDFEPRYDVGRNARRKRADGRQDTVDAEPHRQPVGRRLQVYVACRPTSSLGQDQFNESGGVLSVPGIERGEFAGQLVIHGRCLFASYSQMPSGIGLASTISIVTLSGPSTRKLLSLYCSFSVMGSMIFAPAVCMRL